ncbi:MAG TPA: DUF3052 domain-containing protein [Planctomycetota bacterium]|nr:DUF3052 domain-containing protein [Planctomycetota bacterium]
MKSAGYSGTPLDKKLGVKAGCRLWLIDAPAGFDTTLGPLPEGVTVVRAKSRGPACDVIVLFVKTKKELAGGFASAKKRLVENGGLWVAWPKKASGVDTELTEPFVRAHGLTQGLVDNKVCAIDATWSGLRFVIRLVDRKR